MLRINPSSTSQYKANEESGVECDAKTNSKANENDSDADDSVDTDTDNKNDRRTFNDSDTTTTDQGESDDDEERLEQLVFGSDKAIFKTIEKNKTKSTGKKRKGEQIADHFEKRQSVWVDDDDNQMFGQFFFLFAAYYMGTQSISYKFLFLLHRINMDKFDKLSNKIGFKATNLLSNNQVEESLKAK
jgi:hypothetical protein